ncbi:Slk19p Ecym_7101 [Eremothecium cymbalariae DBVPG|uniref:Uncharacterized protein n=1 Tax=Eremothecium cymbalariae (strain CBS 270.75 / DBVPG 7215 / KCTC 17166 / NRRL Y-17582) TaxID=931890 RepID=G8JVT8_ERECY|nr:hypothetical protein Ecym_7101 [Eremothecium cymbalariae DBVPG\
MAISTSRRGSSPVAKPLDELPTNNNFRINDAKIKLTHSPIRTHTDEDYEDIGDGGEHELQPPMKRIKMSSIPKLTQPESIPLISSPQPIEMLDNMDPLSLTSPIKRPHNNGAHDQDHVDQQDVLDIQDDIKNVVDTTPLKENGVNVFEKMTPIKPSPDDGPRNLQAELRRQDKESHEQSLTGIDRSEDAQRSFEVQRGDWDSLSGLIDEKNATIRQLTLEIRNVQDSLWEVTKTKESFEVSNCMQAEELKDIGKEYEQIQAQYTDVCGQKDKLEQRVDKLKARSSELKNELTMAMQNSQILQEKYHTQVTKNEELEHQISDKEDSVKSLETKLEHSQAQIKQLSHQLEQARDKVAEVEQNLMDGKRAYDHQKSNAQQLESQLSEKTAKIEELTHTIEQSKDAQNRSSSELESKITDLTEENLILEKEYQKLLKDYDSETKALRNQIKDIYEENKSLESKYEVDCKELVSLKTQRTEFEKQIKNLISELEEANNELVSKKAEVNELNSTITELKQSEKYLQESIGGREQSVKDWHSKLDIKEEELRRLNAEYESVMFKNGNMEAEHLAELEQLHENMAKFQSMLEKLTKENHDLKEVIANKEKEELTRAESEKNEPKSSEQDEKLLTRIKDLESQLLEKDKDTNHRLQMLAEDLYIQYSSKHEQKVKMLKKSYEVKYQESMDKLQLENSALMDEVTQLQNKVETERREKQELIKMLDK